MAALMKKVVPLKMVELTVCREAKRKSLVSMIAALLKPPAATAITPVRPGGTSACFAPP